MITKLLHQIWNERKQNAWLFLELIVASLFLWLAIDPLYTLICRKNIPSGCDISDVYMIELAQRIPQDTKFNPEYMDNDIAYECQTQVINILRSLPEVAYHTITEYAGYPNSYSSSSTVFTADTLNTVGVSYDNLKQMIDEGKVKVANIKYWEYISTEGGNYPATFNIKDIHTGEYLMNNEAHYPNGVFISEKAAMELFGTTEARGREFRELFNRGRYRVAGVFKDIPLVQYEEPWPLIIKNTSINHDHLLRTINGTTTFLHIRLKEGVNKEDFEKRFHTEVMPKLEIGNFYCNNIISHENNCKKYAHMFGISNMYRLYAGLSAFALFCAFLGLLSSFWIRSAERKCEIGIMRSLGASRRKIISQFAMEGVLLATVAFMVAMPFIMHHLHIEGFSDPLKVQSKMGNMDVADPAYLHNQQGTHFVVVTAASYLFITIVTLIGAIVPAWRATRMLPADALRDY